MLSTWPLWIAAICGGGVFTQIDKDQPVQVGQRLAVFARPPVVGRDG